MKERFCINNNNITISKLLAKVNNVKYLYIICQIFLHLFPTKSHIQLMFRLIQQWHKD